jgi:hypothetical protein
MSFYDICNKVLKKTNFNFLAQSYIYLHKTNPDITTNEQKIKIYFFLNHIVCAIYYNYYIYYLTRELISVYVSVNRTLQVPSFMP